MDDTEKKDKRLQALEELARLDQELGFDVITHGDVEMGGYRLVCTCPACPEQYNVFDSDGSQVGYLRLRHGRFRADVPDHRGETVYAADPEGDGIFEEHERRRYLAEAVAAIHQHIHQTKDDSSDGVRIAD